MKKHNKRKISVGHLVLIICSVLLGLIAITLCGLMLSGCAEKNSKVDDANHNIGTTPKYVFVFLGDGMGTTQVAATRYLQAAGDNKTGNSIWGASFDSFPYIGLMSTHSLEQPTDSAASITAMLTGTKVHNEEINYSSENGGPLEPFAKQVKARGYAVGVVTSTSVDHATPAGMYASADSRYSYDEIAHQGVVPEYLDFLGGGGFRSTDTQALLEEAQNSGFEIYQSAEEIRTMAAGTAPVLALASGGLDGYDLAYELDRIRAAEYGGTDLSLAELTEAAIRRLETKEKFFLLCEGAKIDTACADGDLLGALYEVQALDDAVKVAMAFYEKHPEDTLIITLADHETGGLRIASGADLSALQGQIASGRRFKSIMAEVYQQNGDFDLAMEKTEHYFSLSAGDLSESQLTKLQKAFEDDTQGESFTKILCSIMQENASVKFETVNHTGQPVAVYGLGASADNFSGVYDNTEIYVKLSHVLGIE